MNAFMQISNLTPMDPAYPPLTAYRIHLDNGTSYITSMAAGVSLSDARRHFLGQHIAQADDSAPLCIAVEPADQEND